MPPTSLLRNILEIALGLVYLIGAVFGVLYTFRHGEVFYGSFADSAWLRPVRGVIRRLVVPNARLLTLFLVLFQFGMAILILTRGEWVKPALLAGALFSLAAVWVSNTAGALANAGLAALQAYLAFS